MTKGASSFAYVTCIRSKPADVWKALTIPELVRGYWFGYHIEADWNAGSPWKLVNPAGALVVSGRVSELEPAQCLTRSAIGEVSEALPFPS